MTDPRSPLTPDTGPDTGSHGSPPETGTRRVTIAIASIAAIIAFAVAAFGFASPSRGGGGAQSSDDTGALESRVQSLVDAGYPAALASMSSPDGTTEDAAAGDLGMPGSETEPGDSEIRIASNTKMFVATVVLQLVDEGTVALDEPIETYLPGLIVGDGIDGRAISVRQLLQHTSGLPEYVDQVAADAFGAQNTFISSRDMLDIALERPAVFAPGERWQYSNTNYLALGLLIERVTDRALWEQIDERIVEPLGLDHTYLPVGGERELRGEHPTMFHAEEVGELRDISSMDPSFAWSAGAMVSTTRELNTFMTALVGGDLLSATSLTDMQTAVAAGDELTPGSTYGLGLQSYPLSCGGVAWGHGGDIPGTQTRNAVGPDGTAVTVAVTSLPWAVVDPTDDERLLEQYRIVLDVVDETLCSR